jgi:hypothetical protein
MVHAFLGTRKRTQGEEVVISLPGGDYSGRATRVDASALMRVARSSSFRANGITTRP